MDAAALAESALRFDGQEHALRSETLRAVAALDLLGAGIVGIDPEGRIEYIDRVASELTGWTLQSARTRPAGEVLILRDPATNCDGSDEPGLKGALRILVGRSSREVPVFVSSTKLRGDLEGRRVVVLRDATAECALRW